MAFSHIEDVDRGDVAVARAEDRACRKRQHFLKRDAVLFCALV